MSKKRRQPRPQQDGLIPVDAEKVERLMVRRGWSKTKLADEAELSRNTVLRIFREHLLRHPTVFERIGPHPHIVENLSTAPGASGDAWWVIDRWVEGTTLEEILGEGLLDPSELPRVMTEVARGLEALHQAQVVFRELAPRRVLIAADSGRAVLTDFELAKLVGAGPTVSADWPDDPYRAPEVESGTADERSDLYSCARMLLHAATGALPPAGDDEAAAPGLGLPKKLSRVVAACLSPAPSDRPKSVGEVLQALDAWSHSPSIKRALPFFAAQRSRRF